MRFLRTLSILFPTPLLSDCGDSDTRSAQDVPKKLKPCELLTAEDIQQVTGYAIKPGVELHKVKCSFKSVETKEQFGMPRYRWFIMHVYHPASAGLEVGIDQDGKREYLGDGYKSNPVAGIGDQAYWEQFPGVTQLTVYKADGSNNIDTISIRADFDGEGQAKALAQRALQRL